MKIRYLAAVAALALSGCAMSGFVEAPAATEYFTRLVKAPTLETLQVISVCAMRVQPEGVELRWYATAMLSSGNVYQYRLNLYGEESPEHPRKPVELEFNKTKKQVDAMRDSLRPPAHCLYNGESYRILGNAAYRGAPRVFVAEDVVARGRFDDGQRQLLLRAAEAAEQAAELDKNQNRAAVNASWGIKP
jgi:hypothetical protein